MQTDFTTQVQPRNRFSILMMGGLIASGLLTAATTLEAADTMQGTTASPGTTTPSSPITPTTGRTMEQGALSEDEKEFVTKAAQGNLAEVILGTHGQNHATREEVRQFGQRLVVDHSKANEQLKAIADANGLQWPEKPSKKQQETADELAKLSGAEYDMEYMKAMVEDHEKDVKKYQEMAEKADNEQLKQYVTKTLPVLKQHLDQAKSVEKLTQGKRG